MAYPKFVRVDGYKCRALKSSDIMTLDYEVLEGPDKGARRWMNNLNGNTNPRISEWR